MERRILLDGQTFFDGQRVGEVRAMLTPLALSIDRVHVRSERDARTGGQVIVAYDQFSSTRPPRDRMFKSPVDDILCQYFELWAPDRDYATWCLTHVYLHLYERRRRGGRPIQLACLHAEPVLPIDEHQTRVRVCPHVHIKGVTGRSTGIASSHLPLNYSHLEDVLVSKETFREALEDGVRVLVEEVLHRLRVSA